MFEAYSRAVAITAAYNHAQINRDKLAPAIAALRCDPGSSDFLHAVLEAEHLVGRRVMSNPSVRFNAQLALIDAVIAFDKEQPSQNVFFSTFAWDEGFTWERNPCVDLIAMQRRVDKAVRRAGWEGVFVFEVDGFRPITGEPDKRLCFHVHGLCFSGPHGLSVANFRRRLADTRSFPNNLLATAVILRPMKTMSDYARTAEYELKPPICEKNLIPSRKHLGRFVMRSTSKGFRPSSALRLAEIWSHITPGDAVFSVGPTAGSIAATYRASLRESERIAQQCKRRVVLNPYVDVHAEWAKIRRDNGSALFGPVRIITASSLYRTSTEKGLRISTNL